MPCFVNYQNNFTRFSTKKRVKKSEIIGLCPFSYKDETQKILADNSDAVVLRCLGVVFSNF